MSDRICITGAAGFIGSNLVRRCLSFGFEVDAVDDLSNGHKEFLTKGCTFLHADFSSDQILSLVKQKRYSAIVHLAAIPRVSYSVEHPLSTNDSNVTKTLKLIDAARDNTNDFIFASSSSVYGGADVLPTPETHVKNPQSPYALQKSIIEDYLKLYKNLYGLHSTCLRFFNVFGPNALGSSPYATALSSWMTSIKTGKPIRSDGDGTQSRDLCYVDNVTDMIIKVLTNVSSSPVSDVYNVACGDRTTNNQIIDYLLKRYPNATKIDAPWRAGDVMHTQADITRAVTELRYKPVFDAMMGIELTCDWFDENWKSIKNMSQNV